MSDPEVQLLYRTHPGAQDAMMLSGAEEVLFGGAMGGGKSRNLRAYGVDYCLRYPGALVPLFRQTYRELEDTHILSIQHEVPESIAEYKVGSHNLIFNNGSILMFRFCETDDDVRTYFTSEFDALLIDELTEFSEYQYVNLLSRVRSTKPWWPGPRVRCGCMPGGRGHDWVKGRWIDFAKPYEVKRGPDEEGGLTRQFIPAKVGDNPSLTKVNPNYLKQLKALPDEEYRAKALGDWEIFSGQYFSRWRNHVHVCETFPVPPDWGRYMVVDYGFAQPHSVLWAARPPNTDSLWIYREQYGPGVPARAQVQKARESTGIEKINVCVLDPSMFSRRPEQGSPISDDWQNGMRGICEVVAGNNDRIPGWSVLRDTLDWTEGPSGVVLVPPRLHVMKSCPNTIRTLPKLQRDKNNVEDADTTGEDHAPDCLRYLTRYLFGEPEKPKAPRYVLGPKGLVALPARAGR